MQGTTPYYRQDGGMLQHSTSSSARMKKKTGSMDPAALFIQPAEIKCHPNVQPR